MTNGRGPKGARPAKAIKAVNASIPSPETDLQREAKDNQLYTTKEAADFLKLNVQTLANWRAGQGSGGIPFIKTGKSVKYRHADLVAFIEARTYTYTTEAQTDAALRKRR